MQKMIEKSNLTQTSAIAGQSSCALVASSGHRVNTERAGARSKSAWAQRGWRASPEVAVTAKGWGAAFRN